MDEATKWEYSIRYINNGHNEIKAIEEMVAKGYRLVAVSPYYGGNSLYFERKAQSEPPKS